MTFFTLGKKIEDSEVLDIYLILLFHNPSLSELDTLEGCLKMAELWTDFSSI